MKEGVNDRKWDEEVKDGLDQEEEGRGSAGSEQMEKQTEE